jgi:hypothetical protein
MTYSKEFLDWVSRRMMRHIDYQIYFALQNSPFNRAQLPPLTTSQTSTRDRMPYPYKREPHRCGPTCSIPLRILMYAT